MITISVDGTKIDEKGHEVPYRATGNRISDQLHHSTYEPSVTVTLAVSSDSGASFSFSHKSYPATDLNKAVEIAKQALVQYAIDLKEAAERQLR